MALGEMSEIADLERNSVHICVVQTGITFIWQMRSEIIKGSGILKCLSLYVTKDYPNLVEHSKETKLYPRL